MLRRPRPPAGTTGHRVRGGAQRWVRPAHRSMHHVPPKDDTPSPPPDLSRQLVLAAAGSTPVEPGSRTARYPSPRPEPLARCRPPASMLSRIRAATVDRTTRDPGRPGPRRRSSGRPGHAGLIDRPVKLPRLVVGHRQPRTPPSLDLPNPAARGGRGGAPEHRLLVNRQRAVCSVRSKCADQVFPYPEIVFPFLPGWTRRDRGPVTVPGSFVPVVVRPRLAKRRGISLM